MNVDFDLIQANERSELRETIMFNFFIFANVFFFFCGGGKNERP